MRFHRGARCLVALVVVVVFGLLAGSALADGPATFVRQFGGVGSASGDLNTAAGLAVDPATGDLLVADDDNERIDVFTSSGNFVKAWGAGVADGTSTSYQTCNATTTPCRQGVASASPGGMNRPKGVAVDGSGNVFVADSASNRIDEFDSSGTFLKAWGWGVHDGRQQFETCTSVCQAGIGGGGDGQLASPFGVAVSASGAVFVAEYGNSRVSVFDPSSATVSFLRAWGWGVTGQQPSQFGICTSNCQAGSSGSGSAGGQGGAFDGATGITVDPSSGDVYVNDSLNYRVQQFHATGAFVRTWGWGVADGQPKFETCTTTASDSTGCQPGIAGHGDGGQFDNGIAQPVGIAVDATGNIDAVDQFNNRVEQFARDGTFQNLFGYGVSDGQNQFENCATSCQQGKSGTNPGELFLPTGIATDTTGDLYVDNGNVIEQYTVPVAALTAPSGVAAATAGATEIDLNWNAVSGATGYKVLRATTTGGPYTTVGTPTGTSFNDTGLTPGTTYYYVVQATSAGTTSPNSAETSASTAPAAPTGLSATAVGSREIDLSWNAASGATGYEVLRSTTSGGPYTQIATPTGTSYQDTLSDEGTTYFYVVAATNASGIASANSAEASATTGGRVFVVKSGDGSGRVTSDTGGIDCGSTCSSDFAHNAQVTLTATPDPGSRFAGWAGGCAGTGTCQVTVDLDSTVNAIFVQSNPTATPHVYWADSFLGQIGESNLDGTGVNTTLIHTGVFSEPEGLAVDDQHIYWTNGPFIGRANLDGSGFDPQFITSAGSTIGVAVDARYIYWANNNSGTVGRANLDGSGVNQSFMTGLIVPQDIAVDSQHIYWSNGNQSGIGRANLDGTGATQSFIPGAPQGLAPDAQHLYWANGATAKIEVANLDGTITNPSLVNMNVAGITGGERLALDAQHIYWSWSNSSGGHIGVANLDGTSVNSSLISATRPVGVAVSRWQLTTTKTGSGSGSITSDTGTIDCGTTCTGLEPAGQQVTLTAKPDPGSVFTGWNGGGCTGTATCTVTTGAADQTVSATFAQPQTLRSVVNGPGSGSVTSDSGGIDCGLTCFAQFGGGTAVTLTARPDSGATFAGWSGGGCTGTQSTCTVTMDADKTVTATFSGPIIPHLYWTSGSIGRSNLDGTAADASFVSASFSGAVAADDQHVYWTWFDFPNSQGGIGRANLDGSSANPNFIALAHGDFPSGVAVDADHIYWGRSPTGGSGTSSIARANLDGAGINQSFITTDVVVPGGVAVDAQHIYWADSAIERANLDGTGANTLVPSSATGGQPVNVVVDGQHVYWSDGSSVNGGIGRADLDGSNPNASFISAANTGGQTGALALDGQHIYWAHPGIFAIGRANLDGTSPDTSFIQNVSALGLAVSRWQLTTTKTGAGSGTITSDTGTIDCGTTCTGLEPAGQQVTLTAKPDPGSVFTGWNGGGCTGTAKCTVTTGAANQAVTAGFSETFGATTGTVRSVTTTGAQVFGLVNPDGTDAGTWFEYGTDTNYGSQTTPDDAGTQNGYVAQADLTGLKPGTTYHYRIVAQQGSGAQVFGADRTFTTLGPRVSGISVGSIGQHNATVSVNVDPAGHDTTVHLDYGTDTSYGSQSPSDATVPASGGAKTVQIALTTLQPGTTYHYRLVIGSSDATITSGDNTFTTTACPQCAKPSIGGIQTQSAPAPGQDFDGTGTVSALVDPHGLDTDVHVDYGSTSSYGASVSGTSVPGAGAAQTVAINLSNLTANATYHFRVVAHNINGTTSSTDQTFTACASCAAPTISNVQVVQTSPDTVPATANTNVLHDGSAVISAVVDTHGLSTQVKLLEGTKDPRTGHVTTGPFLHGRVGPQTVSGGPTIVQFSPQNLNGGDYTFQIIATNSDGADQTADPAATGAFNLHIPAAIANNYPGCTLAFGSTPSPPTFEQTPTVATVNDRSATLSATIDPKRCNTLVSVSYRPANTTVSHALTTTAQGIAGCVHAQGACSAAPPTTVQLPVPGQIGGGVAGLQPDTTYKANVVATSSAGTTTSSTITFTTSAALLPQTATATATTASSSMACATAQACSGTAVIAVPAGGLALDAGTARAGAHGRLVVLGRVPFRIRGHHRAVIKVPLNARGRRAVRQHRTLKAFLVITFKPPGKKPYTVRHPIKIVRRR